VNVASPIVRLTHVDGRRGGDQIGGRKFSLEFASKSVGFNIQLCFKREIDVRSDVIMVAFYVRKRRGNRKELQGLHNFFNNIPVGSEGDVVVTFGKLLALVDTN
jgi:hypothetical protein